jgi:hypothetical protein
VLLQSVEDESRVYRDLVCVRLDGSLKGADSILYGRLQLSTFVAALRGIIKPLALKSYESVSEDFELG